MRTEEFERSALVELMQAAATVDRMLAQCRDDPALAQLLADVRLRLGDAVDTLAARYGMPTLLPGQIDYYRWNI